VTSGVPYERLMDGPRCFDIPEEPRSAADYFGRQIRHFTSHAVNLRSPRCLGHMSGIVPDFMARVHELVMALNQNLVKLESSKSCTLMERETIAMLHREVYGGTVGFYEEKLRDADCALGVMASGGTVANITALWCARNRAMRPAGAYAGVRRD